MSEKDVNMLFSVKELNPYWWWEIVGERLWLERDKPTPHDPLTHAILYDPIGFLFPKK